MLSGRNFQKLLEEEELLYRICSLMKDSLLEVLSSGGLVSTGDYTTNSQLVITRAWTWRSLSLEAHEL
jgi:hypothetical protein